MFQDVYTVNITPNVGTTRVNLTKNEVGKKLLFMLFGREKILVPGGTTAYLSGVKPDGVVYCRTGTVDASSNTIEFDVDPQMTAVAGRWEAKITFTYNGSTTSTSRVLFVVDEEGADPNLVSDSVIDGFVAVAREYANLAKTFAEAAKSEAYGSPLTAMVGSAMIDTTRVYIYTGEEESYEVGHWYYYDGSEWVDGGCYNAIDETLKISGKAADARAVGIALRQEREERIAADAELQTQISSIDTGYLVIDGNWES